MPVNAMALRKSSAQGAIFGLAEIVRNSFMRHTRLRHVSTLAVSVTELGRRNRPAAEKPVIAMNATRFRSSAAQGRTNNAEGRVTG